MNPRRSYHHAYYLRVIQPKRKIKPPHVMVSCPFCDMLNYPSKFEGGLKGIRVFFRFGSRFQNALTDSAISNYGLKYAENVIKSVMNNCLKFLKFCVGHNFITIAEIGKYFDIGAVRYATAPSFASMPFMSSSYDAPLSSSYVPSISFKPKIGEV